MGVGAPGVEQFRDAIIEFRNPYIITAMSPLMTMRSQIILSDSFKEQGGMTTTAQNYFCALLQNCDKWRRVVTYNPNREDLGGQIKIAIKTDDVKGTDVLLGQTGQTPLMEEGLPFGGDEVMAQTMPMRQLPWPLDNSDVNIPTNSKLNFRSNVGMLLLEAVDQSIVAWTRLESRNRAKFITVMDSMRVYGNYIAILEYLRIFGGDGNLVDIANGVRPSEEPRGPNNAPNMLSETAGADGHRRHADRRPVTNSLAGMRAAPAAARSRLSNRFYLELENSMFTTAPIVASGNAAIVACNESNAAESELVELRAAAVAAIKSFNDKLGGFVELRKKAIDSLRANGLTSSGIADDHEADVLFVAIPDPDAAPERRPPEADKKIGDGI
jgi:hypothetical protein